MTRVFTGRVSVQFSQFYVTTDDEWDGDMAACFRGQINGLAGAATPGRLFLVAGLHTGDIQLDVETHDEEPRQDDGWEDCVEVSFEPRDSVAVIRDWNAYQSVN